MRKPDYILLSVVGVLILSGVAILTSVSAVLSQEKFGTTYYYECLSNLFLNPSV